MSKSNTQVGVEPFAGICHENEVYITAKEGAGMPDGLLECLTRAGALDTTRLGDFYGAESGTAFWRRRNLAGENIWGYESEVLDDFDEDAVSLVVWNYFPEVSKWLRALSAVFPEVEITVRAFDSLSLSWGGARFVHGDATCVGFGETISSIADLNGASELEIQDWYADGFDWAEIAKVLLDDDEATSDDLVALAAASGQSSTATLRSFLFSATPAQRAALESNRNFQLDYDPVDWQDVMRLHSSQQIEA